MPLNFNKVEFECSYGTAEQLPKDNINMEFVFSGRSNVGKSSLINKIFNRKHLARVSSMPGKTSTINFFRVDNIRFVDLPGYGYAKVAKTEKTRWKDLINGYISSGRDIVLLFQLIDMRHPPSKNDLYMIDFLIEAEIPFVIILTKSDKLNTKQRLERLENICNEIQYADQIRMIPFSSITGEGVNEIRAIINEITKSS